MDGSDNAREVQSEEAEQAQYHQNLRRNTESAGPDGPQALRNPYGGSRDYLQEKSKTPSGRRVSSSGRDKPSLEGGTNPRSNPSPQEQNSGQVSTAPIRANKYTEILRTGIRVYDQKYKFFAQPRYKDITLPEIQEEELEDIEQSIGNIKIAEDFTQTMASGYFTVNLDDVDIEQCFGKDPMELDPSHQADPEDITLFEPVAPYQSVANLFDRFERFDIDGDDETHMNFASQEPTNIASFLIPSPPHPEQLEIPDEILDQHPKDQANQDADEEKEPKKMGSPSHHPRHGPVQRKRGKTAGIFIDEQIIIPGSVYQAWLQDTSDIVSPRGGRKKKKSSLLSNMNIAKLMELPPTMLSCGLIDSGNNQIHYPKPLLELWNRNTQLPPPSGKISPPQPPRSLSPPDNGHYNDQGGFHFEDVNSGFGSGSFTIPIEYPRATNCNDVSTEIRKEQSKISTPGNSGELAISYHSSGSAPKSDPLPEDNVRSSKKRPHSSARHSANNLEPVLEDNPWENQQNSNSKLPRIDEIGLTLDTDLFVETAPTQTQLPIVTPPVDHFTDAIKSYLKTHFDSPGAAQTESLNELAYGMNKTKAAQLFYQTCVLGTRAFVRVEQKLPYGDILISRGAKM